MRMEPFSFDLDPWTEKMGAGFSSPRPGYILARHASVNLASAGRCFLSFLAAVDLHRPVDCYFYDIPMLFL